MVAVLIILAAIYRLSYIVPPGAVQRKPATSFNGLPAIWGVVGFYLHAFDATPLASVLTVGIALVFSLLPFAWPNPLHSSRWKAATWAALALWFGTAAFTLLQGFPATPLAKAILLAATFYGIMLTVLLNHQAAGADA